MGGGSEVRVLCEVNWCEVSAREACVLRSDLRCVRMAWAPGTGAEDRMRFLIDTS